MLETRKVDNNIRKALFVNLRPLYMYALLQKLKIHSIILLFYAVYRCVVVQW